MAWRGPVGKPGLKTPAGGSGAPAGAQENQDPFSGGNRSRWSLNPRLISITPPAFRRTIPAKTGRRIPLEIAKNRPKVSKPFILNGTVPKPWFFAAFGGIRFPKVWPVERQRRFQTFGTRDDCLHSGTPPGDGAYISVMGYCKAGYDLCWPFRPKKTFVGAAVPGPPAQAVTLRAFSPTFACCFQLKFYAPSERHSPAGTVARLRPIPPDKSGGYSREVPPGLPQFFPLLRSKMRCAHRCVVEWAD